MKAPVKDKDGKSKKSLAAEWKPYPGDWPKESLLCVVWIEGKVFRGPAIAVWKGGHFDIWNKEGDNQEVQWFKELDLPPPIQEIQSLTVTDAKGNVIKHG